MKATAKIIMDIIEHIYKNKDKYPLIDTNKNILMQLTNLDSETIKDIAKQIFKEKYPK